MPKINTFFYIFALLMAFLISLGTPRVHAAEWRESDNHRFRVFLGSYDDARLYGAFAFELKGKWKTYWKNVGDAGLPLKVRQFIYEGASHDGAQDVVVHWPAPKRFFYQEGLYSYVYGPQVVIPFSFRNRSGGKDVKIRLVGEYSVCDVLCVPYSFDETLEASFDARRVEADRAIGAALQHVPKNAPDPQALDVNITADRNIVNISFRSISFRPETLGRVRDVLVDGGDTSLRAPKIVSDGDKISALFNYQTFGKKPKGSPFDEVIKKIKTILVQTDRGTFRLLGGVDPPPPLAASEMMLWPFILILASAFLGGLILNIMPCVLPVISLKLVQMTQPATSLGLRAQLGWTILGLMLSFVLLAAIVYGLQQSGEIVGWGFHFQQPVFVLFMMSVLLFFAFAQMEFLKLGFASSVQGGVDRFLDRFHPDRPVFHIFYGGVIALLATPCTAPFLGSAVGFALTQSFAVIFLVFAAIGLGLALPLLVLLIWPHWGHIMPRAGRWTVYVRNVAAVLLYGSALWLLWVAAGQLGSAWAISFFVMIHAALLILSQAGLRYGRYAAFGRYTAFGRYAAFGMILAAIMAPLLLSPTPSIVSLTEDDGLVWHRFNEQALNEHRQSGKIVFVDISADWCLTCKYNKANVLRDGEVRAALGGRDVYLMAGDLTRVDQEITRFIRKEGRAGIPFNGFYGRHRKKILSEILTKKNFLNDLEAIKANNY